MGGIGGRIVNKELLKAIEPLIHSPVKNYVIPGLTSSLVGGHGGASGTVRLFTCDREHEEPICPHSHRFSFTCFVLVGSVRNRIWTKRWGGDKYESMSLLKVGEFGSYERSVVGVDEWRFEERSYLAGEVYAMKSDEVHSIYFSKGAKVLFFEGPEETTESVVLQPVVDGVTIPTFRVDDWMFRREQQESRHAER